MSFLEYKNKVKIATFIDLENVNKLENIPFIFSYLDSHGFIAYPRKLVVSKISQEEKFTELIKNCCLELVISYKRLKKGKTKRAKDSNKNNADFRYYIEVMECLYKDDPDAFCIVTSDEDYTELILKLRSAGKYIIGVGNKEVTSEKYQALFNEFIFVDDIAKLCEQKQNDELKIEEKTISLIPHAKDEKELKDDKVDNKAIAKAKELERKKLLNNFLEIAKQKISVLKPGKYNLSNITSEIKSEHPKEFSMRINVELYEKLGYSIHIDNNDKSNAYIVIK